MHTHYFKCNKCGATAEKYGIIVTTKCPFCPKGTLKSQCSFKSETKKVEKKCLRKS